MLVACRKVPGARLESLYTVKGIVGSNPTLSAIISFKIGRKKFPIFDNIIKESPKGAIMEWVIAAVIVYWLVTK